MGAPGSLWAFEGRWRLDRRIEHASGQGNATLQGETLFSRSGQTLVQEEVGRLRIDGASGAGLQAERRYLWRTERGWIAISFADGRPFHAVPLGVVDPEATHLCSPDRYEVRYDFGNWPEWTTFWRVTGPRKDYVMTSRYAPAG
jgi:hypothetical protein